MDRLTLERYKKHFSLPPKTKFAGYVVHLPESDEFLAKYQDSADSHLWGWSAIPDLALTFKKKKQASKIAATYGKNNVGVFLLFDAPSQYIVFPPMNSFT